MEGTTESIAGRNLVEDVQPQHSDRMGSGAWMAGLRAGRALARARGRAVLLGLGGLAFLLPACSSSSTGQSSTRVQAQPRSLLIVGDSVAVLSSDALVHLAPEGTKVTVDAVLGGALLATGTTASPTRTARSTSASRPSSTR